mgnify:CR=1 FL=1
MNFICLPPEETFWRQVRHHEFDASEFSLSYLTFLRSREDWAYVGIPAFVSRFFRHSCIYVNKESGIENLRIWPGNRWECPCLLYTSDAADE